MRNYKLFLVGILVLAVGLAAGCGKRALTKSEQDRLAAISAKIAEAERIGPRSAWTETSCKGCCGTGARAARVRGGLGEGARGGSHEGAEAAAEALLKATKDCVAKRKPQNRRRPRHRHQNHRSRRHRHGPRAAVEEKAALDPVYFDFDKSFIREDAKPALQKTATT